ncbi:MAG: hypothetical protein JXM71_02495, partial [Spirochaetales bacterium]|nr:hypothetical protein [Spirochaetales bacterium]
QAFGQTAAPAELSASREQASIPQFAVSMLTDHFEKDAREGRTGGIVLTAIGGTIMTAGLGGLVYSLQEPPTALYTENNGWLLVRGVSIATAAGGALIGGLGLGVMARPLDAYKDEYAYMYAETDPVVQEAMAYGIMKELADNARRSRITGSIINLGVPLVMTSVWAVYAGATDTWDEFGGNVLSTASWTIPSLVSGIAMLISGTSSEERLLESYRAVSSSYALRARDQD